MTTYSPRLKALVIPAPSGSIVMWKLLPWTPQFTKPTTDMMIRGMNMTAPSQMLVRAVRRTPRICM